MNRSGEAARWRSRIFTRSRLRKFSSCSTTWRFRSAGCASARRAVHGGHNGLESIIVHFGTEAIPRLRVGIGAAPARGAVDYVLGRFFEEEMPVVEETIERAAEAVKCAIDKGAVFRDEHFQQNHPES